MKKDNDSNFCKYCNGSIFTIISGSFRKHLLQIAKLKQELEKHHILVLSPIGAIARNPDEEFIILDSDQVSHPKVLQDSIFAKIRRSTFITLANVDGYIGKAAVMEMGYAIALGIPIYTLEPVEDPNIAPYCKLLNEIFPEMDLLFLKRKKINERKINEPVKARVS